MYFVYVLECADGSLYTGITTDIERRFLEHTEGKGGNYTRAKKPMRILYHEKYPNRNEASKREGVIKRLSRGEKLKLIKASAPRPSRRGAWRKGKGMV